MQVNEMRCDVCDKRAPINASNTPPQGWGRIDMKRVYEGVPSRYHSLRGYDLCPDCIDGTVIWVKDQCVVRVTGR